MRIYSMLNLYELVSDSTKLKGSYDAACEVVPELAWENHKNNVEELMKREHLWVKDAKCGYEYARFVLLRRWSEAEPVIMKGGDCAYRYAVGVINGRWPEAEPVIMKDPKWAYNYAKDVIKRRWPEAEPVIMKDPMWPYWYVDDIINGAVFK